MHTKEAIFLLLILIAGCIPNKEIPNHEVVSEIITKSFYVFQHEIDNNKCFPHPGYQEFMVCHNGHYHFYDSLVLYNTVDTIFEKNNAERLDFPINEGILKHYRSISYVDDKAATPGDLMTGFLKFQKVYIEKEKITVKGRCRGYDRHCSFDIFYDYDPLKKTIILDTFQLYVY